MIELEAGTLRAFRPLLRKSVMAASPRGAIPAVSLTAGPDGIRLRAASEEVGLTWTGEASSGSETIVIPGGLLTKFDIADGTVSFEPGRARWTERGEPRSVEFEQPREPVRPAPDTGEFTVMGGGFLAALDAASRIAARERPGGRYALHRVQIDGRAGTIAASDARQALLHRGWSFPFASVALIPAIPIFGAARPLAAEPDVGLHLTEGDCIVRAGPWSVDLRLDAGCFPDIASVFPAGRASAEVTLTDSDSRTLLDKLPDLRGDSVTLVTERPPEVRAAGETIVLAAAVRGAEMAVNVDLRWLARCLALGFRRFAIHRKLDRIVAFDERRSLLTLLPETTPVAAPEPQPDPRSEDMNPSEPAGRKVEPNGRPEPESDESLEAAECLKAALADAVSHAARLVVILRSRRRQRRTVETALASLRSLRLE